MRIGLIAPPFICVPPEKYGGTELFISSLAVGLKGLGHDVVLYTNGESTAPVERRWLYAKSQWPIKGEVHDSLKDINHTAWAIADAVRDCDLIHLNNAPGLSHSRLVKLPFVYTIHHPHIDALSDFYSHYPEVYFVTISNFQRHRERMPRLSTIHHGLNMSRYKLSTEKQPYLAFIGRVAPVKAPHIAIQVAKQAGMPLKIAGEVQPMFREYYEREIKPHVDGKFIEYVGEADLAAKNELLGKAQGMLFPIQWDEPFGLVMAEALACGTPVLALPGGSVPEIVKDGISGWVCRSAEEMAGRVRDLGKLDPQLLRNYAETYFSLETMVRKYADLYAGVISGRIAEEETTARHRAIA
ncbi:MAG: glycosyltransferase family 4 protein [Terriglobales bacterium]